MNKIDHSIIDKNILFILHSYHSFQKDTVENLAKYFKNVHVIVRYKPIAEISNIVKIKELVIHRKQYVIQDKEKPLNVHIHTAPLWYLPTKFFYNILGDYHFKIVDKIIRKNLIKFDLIHSHFTWTAGYVGAKLKKVYKKPFVLTVHENDTWFNKEYKGGNKNIYWTWKSADVLIRINKTTLNKLKKFNKNSIFLPNGYNGNLFKSTDKGRCRKKLKLDQNKVIILSIGHLTERKGYIYLIRSLNILRSRFKKSNFLCLIIGEGPARLSLENEIIKYKLEKHVKLLGSKYHSEIPLYINSSDMVVMPSLAEGTPISMFEALGCGKPFIGTSVGGIPDVITSDKYGYLSMPKDYKSMAANINKAMEKNWNFTIIEKYGKRFTWDNVLKSVLAVYKGLINNGKC